MKCARKRQDITKKDEIKSKKTNILTINSVKSDTFGSPRLMPLNHLKLLGQLREESILDTVESNPPAQETKRERNTKTRTASSIKQLIEK